MTYWIHVAHSIDRVTLHRDRCSEVPSTQTSTDYWGGGWYDYPDKERALAAMEQAGPTEAVGFVLASLSTLRSP